MTWLWIAGAAFVLAIASLVDLIVNERWKEWEE